MKNSGYDIMRNENGDIQKCGECRHCKKTGHLGAVWHYCYIKYKKDCDYAQENKTYSHLPYYAAFRISLKDYCSL